MKRSTFRLRLAIHTMLVAGVLAAGFGAGTWWYARRQLARNLDLRLAEEAHRLWTQLTPRHGAPEMSEAATAVFGAADLEQGKTAVLVQSHMAGNPVIYSTATAPANGFPSHLPGGAAVITEDPRPRDRTPPAQRANLQRPQMPEIREPVFFSHGSGDWRYVGLSSPRYTVFVGLSTHEFYAEVWRAAWGLTAVGSVGLILAGLGGWWLAGRAMRPLQRVVDTAERLSAAALNERIPIKPGDDLEFARLISALNEMIERLHASFEQAARFTADASHELKTPLAVMQVALHDALRSGQPPPMEVLLSEVSRLKSITQSLLLLSQADAGKLPLQQEYYDLSGELAGIAEDADALCAQAGLTCEHTIQPGILINADRGLMRHVFRNLLSNAIKYNRPGGRVSLSLLGDGAHATFLISNTGAGIPLEMQPRLFERFFRVDRVRQGDSTGLGLNIAAELARANGATVTLEASQSDLTTLLVRIPQKMQ